ncbi:hypothetical protein [Bradyrhizobium sp. ARR65]|uniref:hypothetical protein n=1 Tax=Bradyrhizobium sp. ARR65 TaxID=1040989 RepID=UPI000A667246|nr:hypothetical protein [Bradyrhizobium sp. ARR65]
MPHVRTLANPAALLQLERPSGGYDRDEVIAAFAEQPTATDADPTLILRMGHADSEAPSLHVLDNHGSDHGARNDVGMNAFPKICGELCLGREGSGIFRRPMKRTLDA